MNSTTETSDLIESTTWEEIVKLTLQLTDFKDLTQAADNLQVVKMMTTAGANFGDGLSWLELHFSKHVLILFEFRANVLLALKDLITLAVVTLDTTNVLGVVDSDGAEQWDGVLALGQVMEIIKEVAVTTELSNGLIGLDKVSRERVLEVGVLTMMSFL